MECDAAKLEAICADHGIDLVVLFGSGATGEDRRDSDLDLAVHVERSDGVCDRLGLIAALEALLRRSVDLVILNTVTSDTLRHEVFKHGRPLYDKTGEGFKQGQVDAFLRYGDSEYLRRIKTEALHSYLEGLNVARGGQTQD